MAPEDEVEASISTCDEEESLSDTESEGEETADTTHSEQLTKKPSASSRLLSTSTDDSLPESNAGSGSTSDIPLKVMEQSCKASKKLRSEPSASRSMPGAGAKRPAETDAKDSKKAKQTAVEDDRKTIKFQRLWSEEDEIQILKGLMEFKSRKGTDSMNDMNNFYEFIKNSSYYIAVEFAKSQLATKVQRLRKKYQRNAEKAKGKGRRFSKAHEQRAYDLSKKIWEKKENDEGEPVVDSVEKMKKAGNSEANGSEKNKIKIQKAKVDKVSPDLIFTETNVLGGSSSYAKFQDELMRTGIEKLNEDQRKELGDKWKQQSVLETEVCMKRLDLVKEQMAMVVAALKKQP